MTHFEYLSVSVSIMLSLAAARAIGGLPQALESGRRYWLHASWIFTWLWVLVTSWWNIWEYRSAEFSFPAFLLLLSPSGPLLFLCSVLVPANPDRVASWREYFRSVRVRHFAAAALFWALLVAHQPVLLASSPSPLSVPWLWSGFGLAVLGTVFANERLHAVILVLSAAGLAVRFPEW
jgi:hypothetical protein